MKTPGYALLGVTAGARLGEGFDAFIDVRNVTGEKAVGDISAAIRAAPGSAIFHPVERPTIAGGVRARF